MRQSSPEKPGDAYHHGDLRAALVREAIAEIRLNGYEAIKLSVLAKKLGVSQAAPYRHFKDRHALLEAVAIEGFVALKEASLDAVRLPSDLSRAGRIARAYLAFAQRERGLYRLMFASRIFAKTALDGELRCIGMENLHLFAQAFRTAQNDLGSLRRALKVWSALHGIVMLDEMGILIGRPAGISAEELADDIVAQNEALVV